MARALSTRCSQTTLHPSHRHYCERHPAEQALLERGALSATPLQLLHERAVLQRRLHLLHARSRRHLVPVLLFTRLATTTFTRLSATTTPLAMALPAPCIEAMSITPRPSPITTPPGNTHRHCYASSPPLTATPSTPPSKMVRAPYSRRSPRRRSEAMKSVCLKSWNSS